MGDLTSLALVAAGDQGGEGGGGNNFLIPNGTFFVVLAIFLIVLAVIGKWVVPPIMRVLHERDEMVSQTQQNSREADKQFAAADSDYQAEMARARREASGIRDEARAEGRKILEDMKGRASQEAALALQKAGEDLGRQADAIAGDLRSSMATMSSTLASRILGVEVGADARSTAS